MSKDERGNTIVEMVVAMAIISLALLGFLTQATSNYTSVVNSYNRLVATNLAREIIENVRARRDGIWLTGCTPDLTGCVSWVGFYSSGTDYSFINDFRSDILDYRSNYTPDSFEECIADETCRLYWHAATGIYNHSSIDGKATSYYRFNTAWRLCANTADCGGDGICEDGESCTSDEIGWKVTTSVRWFEHTTPNTVVLEDYLYKWR